MNNWSLGYELLRTYVRFGWWLSHKRMVVVGRQLIPKGKPIIFAPNHQNALMDPLALVFSNRRQTIWLARADIFKAKFTQALLRSIKMVPVYRIRDGKENLNNNEQIFSLITSNLEEKQSIALFPEAAHSGKRQMLPHKKAIPRIALEAEAKNQFKLDLQIVPVGIYYSHYWKFNRSVIVVYGNAIPVAKFREEYELNPQKTMLSLRDEIHDRLLPLVLQIDSENHYNEYEQIREIAGEAYSTVQFFNKKRQLQRFYSEKKLMELLYLNECADAKNFKSLIDEVTQYHAQCSNAGISEEQVATAAKLNLPRLVVSTAGAMLSWPLFMIGFLFNILPYIIPRKLLIRKVKDITFLSSFNFGAGLVIFPLFYLIQAGLVHLFSGNFLIALSALIAMPLSGKLSYNLLDFYRKQIRCFKAMTLSALPNLIKTRKAIIDQVLKMAG